MYLLSSILLYWEGEGADCSENVAGKITVYCGVTGAGSVPLRLPKLLNFVFLIYWPLNLPGKRGSTMWTTQGLNTRCKLCTLRSANETRLRIYSRWSRGNTMTGTIKDIIIHISLSVVCTATIGYCLGVNKSESEVGLSKRRRLI